MIIRTIKRETEKAYFVEIEKDGKIYEFWVPKYFVDGYEIDDNYVDKRIEDLRNDE